MPHVERVDAQPLLLITNRLAEAMYSTGNPLTTEQTAAPNTLKNEPSDVRITAKVQQLLDPLRQGQKGTEVVYDGCLFQSEY